MTAEINLKLLSGGKVILADCLGYESELFIPIIINNRIVLQNAAVSRRCCNKNQFEPKNLIKRNQTTNDFIKIQPISQQIPLANSTPTQKIKLKKENTKNTFNSYSFPSNGSNFISDSCQLNLPKELIVKPIRRLQQTIARVAPTYSTNLSQSCRDTSNLENSYPTPDIVRRAPIQTANETIPLPQYPQVTELKIVRLHRVNTPNTPKNLGKIVRSKTPSANTSSPQRILRNLSNVSSFGTPPSLQQTKSFNYGSPNQSFLARRIKTPESAIKWRKCITPKRTYIRHSNGQQTLVRTTELKPLQLTKNGKFIDSYRYPIKMEKRTIIKKRKLIIDNELKITPRKFKKQLTNTEDLNGCKSQLPKSRRHFHLSHMTAFDLLTNSNFYPKIGNKLNTMFRQGCVNRSAETIVKYKQLTKGIPLMEESTYS
ncbi:uncharacterized protein LOC129905570 [Episyrphus balteatus]|uniref:uncharacterized protein LOC129905570 n=1 Tax=Episyrphus balteatus TaxID=286459 RepID=UPI002484E3E7|nr:uncharacterized protein LOC129905570 [Episyrphus balteatus]